MPIPYWFVASFWVPALAVSILLGVFCQSVHGVKFSTRAVRIQQVWFNSIGAFIGWVALWCLVRRAWGVWRVASSGQATWSDFEEATRHTPQARRTRHQSA